MPVSVGDQLRNLALPSVMRGYDRTLVRSALEQAANALDSAEAEQEKARQAIEDLRREREELSTQLSQMEAERRELLTTFENAAREQRALIERFERLEAERDDLAKYVRRADGELSRQRELESSLTNALVSAERSAVELRHLAEREAEALLSETRVKAREIIAAAEAERERLLSEARAVRALLRAALGTVDTGSLTGPHDDEPALSENL